MNSDVFYALKRQSLANTPLSHPADLPALYQILMK